MSRLHRPLLLALSLASVSALASGGPAPLTITSVFARATLVPTSVAVSTCEGTDGVYTVTKLEATGPIVSADARLQGVFFADAVLLHDAQGKGISRDRFRVIDPVTGKLKMKGKAFAVDAAPDPIKGFAIAKLADGSRFFAQSTVYLPAPGTQDPLVIEYGGQGPGALSDHAVILGGNCDDVWEAFDVD
jgi:hypothetical protein